ncbi:MAG: EamA family transporter [Acutalibacteraceae bacterium]|nr:EamA family transporter [Acutalibacteraceae bacterium]
MSKLVYVLIFLSGIFISAVAQILLKKSAGKKYGYKLRDYCYDKGYKKLAKLLKYEPKIREYLNPYVIVSYSIFIGATFCTIFAYTGIPLSFGPILGATEYIFVAILSKVFLKEKINKQKVLGLAIICVGIAVFALKV